MCGGFQCSKSSLTALNILYIVSLCKITFIFYDVNDIFFTLGGWVYPDRSGHLRQSCKRCNQSANYWRHCGMWSFPLDDCCYGLSWSHQTPSSSPVLCNYYLLLNFELFSTKTIFKYFFSTWWCFSSFSSFSSALLVLVWQLMIRLR